jgi:hypothetical protein
MPQINPSPDSAIFRRFKDYDRRLHALECTVPIKKDSTFQTATFDCASTAPVTDGGVTVVGPVTCFGNAEGTNALVTGSCQIGLDSLWAIGAGGTLIVPSGSPIGGLIGVQVDGGTDVEPAQGPGLYQLAWFQSALGGIASTVCGARVLSLLAPSNTARGLSQHTFAMVFVSAFGQTIHFENRALAVDPQ